jgi:hypothetical protein
MLSNATTREDGNLLFDFGTARFDRGCFFFKRACWALS